MLEDSDEVESDRNRMSQLDDETPVILTYCGPRIWEKCLWNFMIAGMMFVRKGMDFFACVNIRMILNLWNVNFSFVICVSSRQIWWFTRFGFLSLPFCFALDNLDNSNFVDCCHHLIHHITHKQQPCHRKNNYPHDKVNPEHIVPFLRKSPIKPPEGNLNFKLRVFPPISYSVILCW